MLNLFKDVPEAVGNTGEVADRCNLELELGKFKLPHFDVPEGRTPDSYLQDLTVMGMRDRSLHNNKKYVDRLEYELGVIAKTGFATYMLIVNDIISWAKQRGIIVGPGRGSAAGSIISYFLNITDIDPIKHELYFERFMNPDRISPPDIDMDIEDRRRDEVVRYVSEKYGKDHVAQIITFGTMFARTAVRDAGRAMGVDLKVCDRIAKAIPMNMSLKDAVETVKEVKDEYRGSKELIDISIALEGVVRHASTHACGIVISDRPLSEYVPIQRSTSSDDFVTTQYDMNMVGEMGLLKMDFLGLRNLSVISDTIKLVKEQLGFNIDLDTIPYNDKVTFDLLKQGKTTSVFQMESAGMKRYMKELVPTEFNDITIMISLYRPGPMDLIPNYIARKHGKEKVEYLHPLLEPILKDTYGIMIYQEQLMAACRALAGFTLSEADTLRKAIGKKDTELLLKQESKLKNGCKQNGISSYVAEKFWQLILPFDRYGFNKAHAVSYATIAYQTAYLKANFPLQFMISEMNSDDNIERIAELLAELNDMGIKVLVPDINKSQYNFYGTGNIIKFALSSIKGMHSKVLENIIEKRKDGPFTSLLDFINRISDVGINKKVIEVLAKSGSLEVLHPNRHQLLVAAEPIVEFIKGGDLAPELVLPNISEVTVGKKLSWEKELLGFYISSNPARQYQDMIRRHGTLDISKLATYNRETVKIGGVISGVKKIILKNKASMYVITVLDSTGSTEVPVFSGVYEKNKQSIAEGNVVTVMCKIDRKRERNPLICLNISVIGSIT
jgi:DNA polymerase-3 subunit alpha